MRTHPILTFLAFFKFLSLFHLAVLGSVTSSLARSVDNALVAVLLTVALASLFFMVVGLLVFSLVEFMGSAVVDLAVLESRSIVEFLSLPFYFHHHYQQCKKAEQLSPTVTNILPTLLASKRI